MKRDFRISHPGLLALTGVLALLLFLILFTLRSDAALGPPERPMPSGKGSEVQARDNLLTASAGNSSSVSAILSETRAKGLPAAIAQLQSVQRQDPSNLIVANQLAILWAAAGDLDKSRETLEQALSLHPEAALAFLNLRELASQQFAQAYAKAIGQSPPSSALKLEAGGLELATVSAAATAFDRAEAERKAALVEAQQAAERLAREQARAEAAKLAEAKAPPPTADAASSAPAQGAEAVTATLGQWAQAWSAKDFQKYSDIYSESFKNTQFSSKKAWLDFRRPRIIGKSSITVELEAVKVDFVARDKARVSFIQRYESGNLKLNTRKNIVMVMENSRWRIQSEGN
nr:hypothetical protein NCPCFENI_00543 [Cupriavidus sp.]